MGSGQPAYDSGEAMTTTDPEFTLEEWHRVLTRLGECETEEDELLYKKADAIRISEMKRRFRNAAAKVGLKDRYIIDENVDLRADIDDTDIDDTVEGISELQTTRNQGSRHDHA